MDSLQKFKLIIMLLLEKWLPTLHCVFGKNACGLPQLFVLIVFEPCKTSLGMLVAVRGQNLAPEYGHHSWKSKYIGQDSPNFDLGA